MNVEIRLDNLYGMITNNCTKKDILTEIDKMCDDFDAMTCNTCSMSRKSDEDDLLYCLHENTIRLNDEWFVTPDFGCNRWEARK